MVLICRNPNVAQVLLEETATILYDGKFIVLCVQLIRVELHLCDVFLIHSVGFSCVVRSGIHSWFEREAIRPARSAIRK